VAWKRRESKCITVTLWPVIVYMRRSSGLHETDACLNCNSKSRDMSSAVSHREVLSAWINNMHVSMQALPAKTRDSRALFDDAIRRGSRGIAGGRDERGKAQKKEEEKRSSPE
jgi:hypothetical protein